MKTNDVTLPLADQLAEVRAQMAELRKVEKSLGEKILKQLGVDQRLEGQTVDVVHVFQIRESLDADKVRGFLHPNQLRAATRVAEVHSLKVVGKPVDRKAE
jgi:hypothetical protein